MKTLETNSNTPSVNGIGLAGRTVPALGLAGGLVCGGLLVALMTLAGRLSGHALLLTSTGLYLIGVLLGLAHAIPLGLLGRDEGLSWRDALRQERRALLYTVAALGFGWPVAGWVAMTVVAKHAQGVAPWLLSAAGWLISALVLVWALGVALRALRRAYARWPERRVGTVLTVLSFLGLLALLAGDRPQIFGSRLRLNEIGGGLVAFFAALWLIGPLVTLVLRALRRLPEIEPDFGFGQGNVRVRNNVLVALLSGSLLTLLVLPFHLSTARLSLIDAGSGAWQHLSVALSRATVDEVLLRVVLSGLLAVLVVRFHLARSWQGVAAAVLATALLQTALYLPGMLGLGLPNGLMLAGYALSAALVPGLVLGALYWTRGLGTALLANAVSLLALAALTIV